MKTKLEVGKEYWLGESKKFKGIYKGSLGKAHYFYITYGDDNFTHDANGFVEFPLHGVFEIEQWQFTTPIAMKCTEDQFNGIKDRLVEIGYRFHCITFGEKYRYLSSNFAKDRSCITDLAIGSKYFKECNPIIFETFNPDLFLALAAMTDKEDGIRGEWWRYTDEMSDPIVAQKYLGEFTVPNKSWRKATAQEIIEHFEKKEFVLPEKWCVKVTKENQSALMYHFCNAVIDCWVLFNGNFTQFTGLPSGCTEITFNQFEKYVDKKTLKHSRCNEYKINTGPFIDETSVFLDFLKPSKPLIEEILSKEGKFTFTIPPSKQATLFDDRVEITDWKPKEGQLIYYIIVSNFGNIKYRAEIYNSLDYQKESLANGFIKRTESEAKQLVEKLKQAML